MSMGFCSAKLECHEKNHDLCGSWFRMDRSVVIGEERYLFAAFRGARASCPENLNVMATNAAMPVAMNISVMAKPSVPFSR